MFAALVVSCVAFAQAPQSEIAAATKSPRLLARYVEMHESAFDWKSLWTALGVQDPKVTHSPCGDSNPCSCELVTVSQADQEILIIRGQLLRMHHIYLRYLRKPNGDWQFAGERSAFVNEYPGSHEVTRVNGRPYLKIRSDHSQVGFALLQEVEEWFDLTQPGFRPVISFTSQGSYEPFSFAVGRTVEAQASASQTPGRETIEIVLNVHFNGIGLDIPATFIGIYERPSGARAFSIRRAYSDPDRRTAIPTEDLEGLGGPDLDKLSNERLVFYALSGLQTIASGSDEEARQWLKLVLEHVRDTPEKRALLDLLRRR